MAFIITKHQDAAAFVRQVRSFLLQRECENCLLLGMISALEPQTAPEVLPLLLAIESNSRLVGVGVQTRPIAMAITRLPLEACAPFVSQLHNWSWPGQGVTGPVDSVDLFADTWAKHSGQIKRVHHSLRVYQLTTLSPPAAAPGRMLPASPEHLEVLAEWHDAFSRFLGEPDADPRQSARRAIDSKRLFVWENAGKLCSMTGISGITENGIRINRVYTPPESRGKGFASNLVAAVSQRMFDGGRKHCFLFTDLENPTSNSIYQKIGYQPFGDFRHWMFEGPNQNT